jgi:hypothetical protein
VSGSSNAVAAALATDSRVGVKNIANLHCGLRTADCDIQCTLGGR